jgi:capsular polysaccharide biosynthesis protein
VTGRRWIAWAVCGLALAAAAYALATVRSPRYRAEVTAEIQPPQAGESSFRVPRQDLEVTNTYQYIAQTAKLERMAGRAVRPPLSAAAVARSTFVDTDNQLLTLKFVAVAPSPERASALVRALAQAFRAEVTRAVTAAQQARVAEVRAQITAVTRQIRRARTPALRAALRGRISSLQLTLAATARRSQDRVVLVGAQFPRTRKVSPHPARDTLLVLLGWAALGFWIWYRRRTRPRARTEGERDLPTLALHRHGTAGRVEDARLLAAVVRGEARAREPRPARHVVVVGAHAETAAAELALDLACALGMDGSRVGFVDAHGSLPTVHAIEGDPPLPAEATTLASGPAPEDVMDALRALEGEFAWVVAVTPALDTAPDAVMIAAGADVCVLTDHRAVPAGQAWPLPADRTVLVFDRGAITGRRTAGVPA